MIVDATIRVSRVTLKRSRTFVRENWKIDNIGEVLNLPQKCRQNKPVLVPRSTDLL